VISDRFSWIALGSGPNYNQRSPPRRNKKSHSRKLFGWKRWVGKTVILSILSDTKCSSILVNTQPPPSRSASIFTDSTCI